MAGIGSVTVRVTPEKLVSQAEEVRRLGNDMQRRFTVLENTMARTRGYWIGEAGDLHRKLYDEQKDNVNQMLRRLLEHPDDLLAISENYKAAEKTNVASATALEADVIV